MANQDTNDTAFILIEPGLARKRNGNRIYARVRVAGKCTWKSTKTDDPELARKWKKKWEEKQWLQKQGYIAKEPESAETPTAAKNDNGGASETKLEPSSLTVNKILDHYVAAGQGWLKPGATVRRTRVRKKVLQRIWELDPARVTDIVEHLTERSADLDPLSFCQSCGCCEYRSVCPIRKYFETNGTKQTAWSSSEGLPGKPH